MGTFVVTIDTDNAAFEDNPGEVSRILREVADRVEVDGLDDGSVRDVNGNRVCGFAHRAS